MIDGFIATFFSKFRFFGGYMFGLVRTWDEAVGLGQVTGASALTLVGENAATADNDALWAPSTAYTWQTADQTPKVVSSDADDDGAPAGNGAQTVRVWWLNSANVEAYEDVTLNGVNNVDMTASTVRRINRVEVLAVGATGYNEGNITVYATDGATVMAYVPAGLGVNDGIIQTVPAGKTDYVNAITFTNTSGVVRGMLWYRSGPSAPWIGLIPFAVYATGNTYTFDVPIPIPAGYDYIVTLDLISGTPFVTGMVHGWRAAA